MIQTWLLLSSLVIPITPDRSISPGGVCTEASTDFMEYRYQEQIPYCVRNVAVGTKASIYNKYRISADSRSEYTIDHIIPLSIGGSNTPSNLWPEHKVIKQERRNLEYCLYLNLRDGVINQKEAIDIVLDAKFHRKENDHKLFCRQTITRWEGTDTHE